MRVKLGYLSGMMLAGLLLSGCASGPKYFDNNKFASDKKAFVEKYTDSESSRRLAKVKKVVIPSFRVEFLTRTSGGSSARDYSSGNSVSASVAYNLKGVSEKTMLSITNSLYDKFVSDLTAAGYEVVPQSALEKSDNYKKLVAKYDKKSPFLDESGILEKDGKSLIFAPKGMPVYFSTLDTNTKKPGLFDAFGQMGSAFKGEAVMNYEGAIMHDFEAALIKPNFVVGFATIEGSKSLGGSFISASVKSEMNITIPVQRTQIQFFPSYSKPGDTYIVDGSNGRVFLKEPMIAGDNIASEVVDVTPIGTTVATGVLNVLSAVSRASGGSGSSMSITEYDAKMVEATYKNAAIQNLSAASELLVMKASSER